MNQINLVQNDTGPDLTVMLYDTASNSPIDVSGSTVVRFHFRKEDGTSVTTLTASKPSGGTDGVVSFPWGAGNLSEAGNYEGEIEITFSSGKVQTVPDKIRFYVREQIG